MSVEFIFPIFVPQEYFLGLNASNRMRALAQIAGMLEREHGIGRGLVYESLRKREQLGSTALGQGVAIPHAKIKGLRCPMTAFVRLGMPIDSDAPDEKPVSEIFVLLVPHNATQEHLQMLADVTEMLCNDRFREQLRNAIEPRMVQLLFSGESQAVSEPLRSSSHEFSD